mmetsp:Transcript_1366/g.3192  ORF Transcript_1366/g.3192 Transcript_1366/m.3192 type:complete len:395 (-) Transcript_1366:568-1752(-)
MDVFLGIVRWIELYDPIDRGDVQPPGRHVRAEEGSGGGFAKLEKGGGPLLLLLTSVYVHDGDVDVIEEFGVEFDRVAGGEEDHDFFVFIFLEKGEEEEETSIGGNGDVSLFETRGGGEGGFVGDFDVHGRFGIDGRAGQVFDFFGLRGREEHGLTLFGEGFDDGAEVVFETLFEDAVGFVHDEGEEVAVDESFGVLEMIQETARSGDDDVDSLGETFGLGPSIGSSHDEAIGLAVLPVGYDVLAHPVDLHGQFASGRDDDGAGAVAGGEFGLVEEFDDGEEEGEGFAGAGFGDADYVSVAVLGGLGEEDWPALSLNRTRLLKSIHLDTLLNQLAVDNTLACLKSGQWKIRRISAQSLCGLGPLFAGTRILEDDFIAFPPGGNGIGIRRISSSSR